MQHFLRVQWAECILARLLLESIQANNFQVLLKHTKHDYFQSVVQVHYVIQGDGRLLLSL